jgi:hypothetical protein
VLIQGKTGEQLVIQCQASGNHQLLTKAAHSGLQGRSFMIRSGARQLAMYRQSRNWRENKGRQLETSTEYLFHIINQHPNERSIQTVGKGALRHARVRDSWRRAEDPGSGSDREAGREDGALGVPGGEGGAR